MCRAQTAEFTFSSARWGGDVNEAQWDTFHPALGDTILLTKPRIMGTSGWLVIGFVKGEVAPCAES